MTPARYYNHLEDLGDRVLKSSIHAEKIQAEIQYYKDLPSELAPFHPRFLGASQDGHWESGYLIEKIPSCDFGQIYTGICESSVTVEGLFEGLKKYLEKTPKSKVTPSQWSESLERQVLVKSKTRLASLKSQSYFREVERVFKKNGWESADAFLERLNRKMRTLAEAVDDKALWRSHGDLCFSNIIPHNERLYLIDPMGTRPKDTGLLVPYYDLAKISQCLLGGYDFINNEVDYEPELIFNGPKVRLMESFASAFGQSYELTRVVEVSHFFSMLPLHLSSPKKVLAFARQAVLIFEEFR